MKSQTLPTKRRPVSHGMFRKLSAVTHARRKKQRVAAAGSARDFDEEGSSKIARALVIILLIHVLAVALIFIHHRFLDGRTLDQATVTKTEGTQETAGQPEATGSTQIVRSQVSTGERPYIVRAGDNYASISKSHQVAEQDLRQLNDNVELRRGSILKIPVKRVVVRPPATVAEGQQVPVQTSVPERDRGLVEAIDVRNAPRAQPVEAQGSSAAAGSYVVQSGDTIWGIATRHGVDQKKLMESNGISDARKLRAGMTLKIP